MRRISVSYALKWQHKEHTNYKWTKCGKLFNLRTGKEIKKVLNGGSVGYWIAGNFCTLHNLKNNIEKIRAESCPF